MCKRNFILPKSTIPERRWQYVCLKDSDSFRGYKGTGSCTLFCSPDGREFETLAQVRKHQRKLKFLSSEKKKKLRLLEERREKEIKLRASLLTKKSKLTKSKPTIPLGIRKPKQPPRRKPRKTQIQRNQRRKSQQNRFRISLA